MGRWSRRRPPACLSPSCFVLMLASFPRSFSTKALKGVQTCLDPGDPTRDNSRYERVGFRQVGFTTPDGKQGVTTNCDAARCPRSGGAEGSTGCHRRQSRPTRRFWKPSDPRRLRFQL